VTGDKTRRQIILADLNDFSKLSDQEQFRTISHISQAIVAECENGGWEQPHAMTCQKWIDHFISTGDGFYILLNPSIGPTAIHGPAISLAIRSHVLGDRLLPGIKIAIHWGTTIEFTGIAGDTSFVGTGMNYCARLLRLCDSFTDELEAFYGTLDRRSLIVVSEELAVHQDWRFLEKLPGFKKAGPFEFQVKSRQVKSYVILADPIHVQRTRSFNPDAR